MRAIRPRAPLACAAVMALSAAPPTPAAVDPAASSGAPAADAITPRPPAPPGVGALDRRIAGAPDDARLYLERGNRYLKAGANERAIADYTRALELDDGLEEAYFNRGMARGRAGRLDAAIADLTIYIERHPRSSLAYTKRGVRHLWAGRHEEAFEDYRKALELDPRNAEAHDDIAVIYAQVRGQPDEALRHLFKAISIDPTYHKAYHNRALVFLAMGYEREALSNINRALELKADDPNAMRLKSVILESLGRMEEARALRERAARLPGASRTEVFSIKRAHP